MPDTLQAVLLTPAEAAQQATATTAPNGVRYASLGKVDSGKSSPTELARLVGAVPKALAAGRGQTQHRFAQR